MTFATVESKIKKSKAVGVIQQIFGWIVAVFCGLIVLAGISVSGFRDVYDFVVVILFTALTALGVLLIIKGHKRIKQIRLYYDYYYRLMSDPNHSMDLLSTSIGTAVGIVTKNVMDMIAAGYFPGAYLDIKHNRLVMQNTAGSAGAAPCGAPDSQPAGKAVTYVTVACKGCGATSTIIAGTTGKCEYCGSRVSEDGTCGG